MYKFTSQTTHKFIYEHLLTFLVNEYTLVNIYFDEVYTRIVTYT